MAKRPSKTPVPTLDYERELLDRGYRLIAGVDEAGRGSIFGPVCVGMAMLPLEDFAYLQKELSEIRDSKTLHRPKVYRLADTVKEVALSWGVGQSTAQEVDQHGIMGGVRVAAERALVELEGRFGKRIDYLLTDTAMPLKHLPIGQHSIVKGDLYCLSVACGAILAKHHHDVLVRELAEQFPDDYQLHQNVGYATAAHRRAIAELGPTAHHRFTFRPIAQLPLPLEFEH